MDQNTIQSKYVQIEKVNGGFIVTSDSTRQISTSLNKAMSVAKTALVDPTDESVEVDSGVKQLNG